MELTRKDRYELAYWRGTDLDMHRRKMPMYLAAWGYEDVDSVLEIGTGPLGGFLPIIQAKRKAGIDPLYEGYESAGLLERCDAEYICARFEEFETDERFDAVLSADGLDHGEMGFAVIPKIRRLLKPGGAFYMHVHIRPKHLLNFAHAPMREADLGGHLGDLIEVRREILPNDIDGRYCAALVGVWKSPP